MKKSCGNCANCDKVTPEKGNEFWACEIYGLHNGYGCPANVTPPYDEECDDWSDIRVDVDAEIEKYI